MISVVIPAKNEEKYIGDCLDSLANSIQNWGGRAEIIIIDNGSEDNTKEIAKSKGCMVVEELEGTISHLRNTGARIARGDIIAFLDADCRVDPDWISLCIGNFQNLKIGAAGTRAVPDFNNATWVENGWYKLVSGAERPDFVEWLGTSNLFIRKTIFDQLGGFNETLETGEDVNLSYRIRENYLIYLEKRVNTIHLRESKTINELFKREFWRGKSSLKTLKESRFSRKEIPSVLIPAINAVSLFFLLLFVLMRSMSVAIPLMVILLLPALFMIRKKVKRESLNIMFNCYIVAFVYIFARTCSLIYEALNFHRSSI